MSQIQSFSRNNCVLGSLREARREAHPDGVVRARGEAATPVVPVPGAQLGWEIGGAQAINPTSEQFLEVQPNVLYIQRQQVEDEKEIGSLVWSDAVVSDLQAFSSLINPPFPTTVYLEVPVGEKLAQAVHSKCIDVSGSKAILCEKQSCAKDTYENVLRRDINCWLLQLSA